MAPSGLTRVFYSDDGSTAMEVALKMAIQYWRQCQNPQPKKKKFVHLALSYHGDTVGGMSLSGVDLFNATFRPLLFPTRSVDPPYCYRCPMQLTYPSCHMACIDPLEQLLEQQHHHIAAVVLEPLMQAVAGMIPSPPGIFAESGNYVHAMSVLFIADEVATGFGRTGRMFACQHEAVTPDLMAVAKGLTGGYLPLAATLTTEKIYEAFLGNYEDWKTFFHGHSYTGNPLGCAAALANLSIFKQDRTLITVKRNIPFLTRLLEDLRQEVVVGDIRQCGYMVGIELVKNRRTKNAVPSRRTSWHKGRIGSSKKRPAPHGPSAIFLSLMPPLCVKRNSPHEND